MDFNNVMVDSVNYRVEKTNEMILVNGRQCAAEVDSNFAVIRLNEEISQSGAAAQVLMHEIIHALLIARGLDEATDDEQLVDALAAGFINLVRTNPKLVEFIVETDDG